MKKILQNKNTRRNLLTYLLVVIGFVVMQSLSATGKLSSAMRGQLIPICARTRLGAKRGKRRESIP